jgi:hypothetical protein
MKTIGLSIPYGMSARNILRSAAFSLIKAETRVIIYSPLAADPAFRKEFSAANVVIKALTPVKSLHEKILRRLLVPIQAVRFTNQAPQIETLRIARDWLKESHPFRYFVYWLFGITVGRWNALYMTLERSYDRALVQPKYVEDFKKENIALLFVTHGYVQDEFELAASAAQLNIPTIAMIHSWDNITGKSGMRQTVSSYPGRVLPHRFYKRILVWNEVLKKELIEAYGYPAERITITGIPQFDIYNDRTRLNTRTEFFSSLNGDPTKKTIVYMGANPKLIPNQVHVIGVLAQAVRNNTLGPNVQLLVRGHPGTDLNEWKRAAYGAPVIFQEPSAAFKATAVAAGWNPDAHDENQLANAIYHSDVVVNVNSTTSIVAAVFDRPIVCVGFETVPINSYFESVKKLYDYTHFKKVVDTKGLRVARSEEEMLGQIKIYLDTPSLDNVGRDRIRHEQCFAIDGRAGERIGLAVLDMLKHG